MAIQFTRASSEGLSVNSAPITAAPFTLSVWFYPDTGTQDKCFINLGQVGINNNRWVLGGGNAELAFFESRDSSSTTVATSNTFSLSAWSHAVAIEASATDHRVILNGDVANQGSSSASRSPTAPTDTNIGIRRILSDDQYMNGRLAEVGMWDAELNADELAALAAGISCNQIRPQSLKVYMPGISSTQELIQPITWTELGTPSVGDHDLQIYRRRRSRSVLVPSAVVVASAHSARSLGIGVPYPPYNRDVNRL